MSEMTTRERFERTFRHQEPDRVPMLASPWKSTLERWHREGMPEGADFAEFFNLDKVVGIRGDISPRYEAKVLEETDEYIIATTSWGTTMKNWKHASSTPHWLDRTIVSREAWEKAKARMVMTPDRVPWERLENHYADWRKKGYWIQASLYFGFDRTHSRIVGTERFLMWMAEDPELARDIFATQLDCDLQLLEMMWDRGYHFDAVHWCDDMGYRNGTFFSPQMYRDILKPYHRRAVEWAHAKGIVAHLHSCGNINGLLPDLVDIGLDALNPLEVKAGMDPVHLKKAYGDRLVLHGGINAMLWKDIDATEAEIRRLLPVLKQGSGYIFQEDHSVPDNVSLEDYRRIVEVARELGTFG